MNPSTWAPGLASQRSARAAPRQLVDDDRARDFTWSNARNWLSGLPHGGGLNMGYEALDRHVADGLGQKTAIRSIEYGNTVREVSYAEMVEATARFANALAALGVMPGERVCTLLGRVVESDIAALGALKYGCVYAPLPSGLGPELVAERLRLADARVLVTTPGLYTATIAPIRYKLPHLRHVLLIGAAANSMPRAMRFDSALSSAAQRFSVPDTDPHQPALLHFTSGTSGEPRGVIQSHEATVAQIATSRYALDLHPQDVFWCTADPGWAMATYGLVAALLHGSTQISDTRDLSLIHI